VTVSFLKLIKEAILMAQLTNFPADTSFRWKQLYGSAIIKIEATGLKERIAEARCAILDRAEEILTRPSCDEHRGINDALRTLRLLEEAAVTAKTAA
jgi:hypothetical protein